MHANGLEQLYQRALQRIKAEPVKAGVLGVLLTVMGTLWVRTVWSPTGGATVARARAAVAASDISPAADNRTARAMKQLAEWVKQPCPEIHDNLFALKLEYFPTDGSRPPQRARSGASFWDEVGKSLASKADQDKARRILLENLRLEASRLELQSTVISNGSPKALVNGKLVGEGDTVAGFKIISIESQRLVVEREGVRIEVAFDFRK